MEVNALVKTLAERLAEVKAKTVSDRLGHVLAKSLVKKFFFYLSKDKRQEKLVARGVKSKQTHWW